MNQIRLMEWRSLLCLSLALSSSACMIFPKSAYDYDFDRESMIENTNGKLEVVELQSKFILFRFYNKAKTSAKIIWDDTSLVDVDGQSHRIIHAGTRLIKSDQSQPATVIPSGAMVSDGVGFADGIQYSGGSWYFTDLVHCSTGCSPPKIEANYGKFLIFTLAVDLEGKRHEYVAKLALKPAAPTK